MGWIIFGVYVVGLVIAYMISILVTDMKPSRWGVVVDPYTYEDNFVYHILSFFWPIVLPFVILYLLGLAFIWSMDRFYDFLRG